MTALLAVHLDVLALEISKLSCGLWVYSLGARCTWDLVDWTLKDEHGAPIKVASGESESFSKAIQTAHAAALLHRNPT